MLRASQNSKDAGGKTFFIGRDLDYFTTENREHLSRWHRTPKLDAFDVSKFMVEQLFCSRSKLAIHGDDDGNACILFNKFSKTRLSRLLYPQQACSSAKLLASSHIHFWQCPALFLS